ncbi:DUF1778 domain-containing protein [Crenothrix polyspora]|uniref:DUF1778 domain-containing protein n=1 Tax=Crenothrix polyspora TaxID=360316 RepID=A0A1R4H3D1_9GAMM|nr:DUF1778 domain-containing protein [Crenothrix polyspora]SJM90742.1 conserved hypothetical protein [Crenothrix polyspora]
MSADTNKKDVLKIRMDPVTLQLLEQARHYIDLDKSKFIRQSIREKAETVIAAHEKTHFNPEDWALFFDMLDNPPEPTERMKKAALTYKNILSDEV